jgi:hypothetical protein
MLVLRELIIVYDGRLSLSHSLKTAEIQIILLTNFFAIFDLY